MKDERVHPSLHILVVKETSQTHTCAEGVLKSSSSNFGYIVISL